MTKHIDGTYRAEETADNIIKACLRSADRNKKGTGNRKVKWEVEGEIERHKSNISLLKLKHPSVDFAETSSDSDDLKRARGTIANLKSQIDGCNMILSRIVW